MPEETSSDKMSKAIAAARGGDPSGLWQAAEGLRPYLETVVENVLRNHLTGRVDPASVVQQALLASIERFPQFNGSTGDEWQQWLAVIARNEASNLLQSDEEGDRDDGAEMMLDAIDALRTRAKEIRSLASAMRDL